MALTQGERSLHIVQVGKETTHGTAVPATARLAGFSTGIVTLDRSPSKVNEDYGQLAMNQPGRGYYGVRLARMPYRADLKFEDFVRYAGSFIAGGVSPSLVATGVYDWAYLMDLTSDTLDSLTIEEGDNIQAYQMPYALGESLRLSYNALAAPGSSPWQVEANFIGQDKIPVAFTGAVSVVDGAETVMGHLTRAFLGPTATAFDSLSEQVGLLAFDLTIPTMTLPRPYGGTDDLFHVHGRGKHDPTGTITFYQDANAKTALFDPFQVFTGAPTMIEKRLRIQARGGFPVAGTNDQQTLTPNHVDAAGGYFTITFQSVATGHIAWNATAAQIQQALWNHPKIGPNNCTVTGTIASAIVVTFQNNLGSSAPGALTADGSTLTGPTSPYSITVVDTTPGSGYRKTFTLDARIRLSAAPVAEDPNGATVYQGTIELVNDSTLGGALKAVMRNAIAS